LGCLAIGPELNRLEAKKRVPEYSTGTRFGLSVSEHIYIFRRAHVLRYSHQNLRTFFNHVQVVLISPVFNNIRPEILAISLSDMATTASTGICKI
jgi:hypothetical protein